jgi:hypothetical protein
MNTSENDKIVAEIDIAGRRPTGKTRHTVEGVPITGGAMLRIVLLAGDKSYYLIHYDKNGNEIADTCHDTIQEALEQAEFEFGLTADEWKLTKRE